MDEVLLHADPIDEIVDYVRSGTNVNVVGMRSSGRSAVVQRVTEILALEGIAVTRIAGVRALRDRPLAALAVAGVHLTTTPNHLQTLTSAVASLEVLLSAKPSVLVIDDADDLDGASVGALVAAHGRLRVPVVTTSRPAGRRQSETSALTAELQPGTRVALPPLRYEGVHQLVHQLLGAPVDPSTVARIAAKSGGLPGLVRAMVDTGRRSSRLGIRGGLWVARKDLWSTSLAQSVEPLLADLDEDGLDALTLLSFAGTLTMESFLRLVAPETVAQLDDAGLVQVLADGGQAVVGVFPPLIAEYITHEGSPTRNMLAKERLRLADAQSVPAVEEMPRLLGVTGAEPVMNRRLAQHWQAEVVERRRKWEVDPSPAAAVPLLEALLVSRARRHELDAVLDATDVAGADPRSLARFVAWQSLDRGLARGDVAAARGMLAERPEGLELYDGFLRAAEGHIALVAEAVPSADLLAAPGPDEDRLSADALTVVRAESLVAAGQARAALDLLADFTTPVPHLARSAEVTRELAELYAGNMDGAISAALSRVEQARTSLDPGALEAHGYVAGLGLAIQGRVAELDDLVTSTLALASTPAHESRFQSGLLALAASAANWQGRRSFAKSLALQADGLKDQPGPHPCMAAQHVTASVRTCDDEAVADRLWELATERLDHGYLPAGIIAGVSAVERHPDAARAARLQEAAAACDSDLFGLVADYAVALAAEDPDLLASMEPRLRAAGLRLYAVRTAVARSVGLLESGNAVEAAGQADHAWHQAGLRGRDLCGLFWRFDRAVNLTAREREVAVLVARGMSSPDIAARMVLSVRTVENHIFSACRKVGVDTRDGLAHAAQTWLSCATH